MAYEDNSLPLSEDWSVFIIRAKSEAEEIIEIIMIFADDPAVEEFDIVF